MIPAFLIMIPARVVMIPAILIMIPAFLVIIPAILIMIPARVVMILVYLINEPEVVRDKDYSSLEPVDSVCKSINGFHAKMVNRLVKKQHVRNLMIK